MVDKMYSRPEINPQTIGYGTFEQAFNNLEKALKPSPFILGNQLSAVDIFVSSQLSWGMSVKAIESSEIFEKYTEHCKDRPAYKRYSEQSKLMIKELESRGSLEK
jgi:glutathione S-transferase